MGPAVTVAGKCPLRMVKTTGVRLLRVMGGTHSQECQHLKTGDNSPHTLYNQCFRLLTRKSLSRFLLFQIVWMNTGFTKREISFSVSKRWHTGILPDALSLLNILISAVPIDWCFTWDSQWRYKCFGCTDFQQFLKCAQPDFKET